jgi:hypothetical protein
MVKADLLKCQDYLTDIHKISEMDGGAPLIFILLSTIFFQQQSEM